MKWSSTATSISASASFSVRVKAMSAWLGSRAPDGWLWASSTAVAERSSARRATSRGEHAGLVDGALEQLDVFDQAVLLVQQQDHEDLVLERRQAQAQPVAYGLGAIEHTAVLELFAEGAAGEFEHGLQLRVLRDAHAGHRREFGGAGIAQPSQGAEAVQQIAPEVHGTASGDADP